MASPAPTAFLPLTHLSYSILLALADQQRHGYGIIKEIEASTGAAGPSTGALYLALQRLAAEGMVEEDASAASPEDDARRKYYRLSKLGRQVLVAESRRLEGLLAVAKGKRL